MSNNNTSIKDVSHDAIVIKPEHPTMLQSNSHRRSHGSKGHHAAIPQDSEENRGGSLGGQSSTSVVDQVRTPPDDAGVTSSSTICPAPVCRQFWKAGSYNDELCSKSQQPTGKNYLHVHPMFLHSNATSHKWAFGAVAELLDNAVDEIQNGATFVIVDKTTNPRDGSTALLVQDDGGGMDPQAMRHCMGFGFSDKKSESSIGRYGNGFKTSTMRLGADVIVFSRHLKNKIWTQSIGLLSYTYLSRTGHDRIVVPILDYEFKESTTEFVTLQDGEHYSSSLSILLEWSPFSTEAELLQQFDNIESHGTKVIIYNLWLNSDAKLELDFDSVAKDILIEGNIKKSGCKLTNDHIASRFSYSLRVYLSILYLRIPATFKIMLCGKVVEQHNIVDDLMHQQYILYKPHVVGREEAEVVTTIGFLKEAPKVNLNGFCVYHKNRLIMPFWQVVSNSNSRGRGVVGALEANFVEPTHNKQDFEKTVLLQKLENRLKEMTTEYWDCHSVLIGYHDKKRARVKVPQNVQPGVRTSRQAVTPPPGFQSVLPRVTAEPVVLEKRKEHPDYVTSAASKRQMGNDGFTVPGQNRAEQLIQGSAIRSQGNETVKLMEENKKLRAKWLDHKVRSQNLELKAMNLRSELDNVKDEYERLMEELQALGGMVKEEDHRRNIWVQRKLSGKKHEPTLDSSQESSGHGLSKDLTSWPQEEETFLSIGTLGNNICPKKEYEEETDCRKDLAAVNKDVTIGKKKSLSFLLKKMFVCTSGFKTPPPLLDLSRGDSSLPNTRMEKMLRTILNKKIHPQRSNAIANKYLENHKIIDEARSSVDANKRVKTDSECTK